MRHLKYDYVWMKESIKKTINFWYLALRNDKLNEYGKNSLLVNLSHVYFMLWCWIGCLCMSPEMLWIGLLAYKQLQSQKLKH